ncbi:MAG: methyltransferase domain-containing protein [Rhodospirillales bacterium]|nr:methyltransferase domain-containing protein [Rhodospirillales bacterium]MDE2573895.1 methyltransferase domain-containing protein [Rhodospirillales bacterium]
MTLPPSQALDWEERYQTNATGWQRAGLGPAFTPWLADGTLRPGRILLPGAGRSHEPRALAEAGFDVTVVDVAPSAVAYQAEHLAPFRGRAIAADLFAWTPPGPFDAIYEQTCLCALPPAMWEAYAARLAGWLRPGGVLAVLFVQTGREGGPPFHCAVPRMRELFPASLWIWPAALQEEVAPSAELREQPAALIRR